MDLEKKIGYRFTQIFTDGRRNFDECAFHVCSSMATTGNRNARLAVINKFFLAFIPIFVAIDPIGLVAVFIGLGTSASRQQRQRQALLGILTGLCVAIGFIFLGRAIFSALGITLIAGPALLTALLILVDTVGLVFTLVSLLVNLGLVAIAFCNADQFTRWMGRQGLRGVSKIIALLLAAIAVSLIRRGWHTVG